MMETMPKPFVAITYYALYILGVLILVPAIVYVAGWIFENYVLNNNMPIEDVMQLGSMDSATLILSNLFIAALFLKRKYVKLPYFGQHGSDNSSASVYLMAMLMMLVSILPLNLFVSALNLNDYSEAVASDGQLSFASIIGISILAPLAEEIVFRGGIEEKLLQWKTNPWIGILISAFMFAILHFYPSLIIGTFISGILLGWVYYKTRNVMVCFGMHLVNNSASCVIDYISPGSSFYADIMNQTRFIIIAIFCLLILVALINRFRRIS